MTTNRADCTQAVIPEISIDSRVVENEADTKPASKPLSRQLQGTIAKKIGSGDNAKNSIVWMTITWSFIIATVISICIYILLLITYFSADKYYFNILIKHSFSMWSIFTPIITLALGYAFGKNETK